MDALFVHIAYDYSCADWDGLCDHLRDIAWLSAAFADAIVHRNHFFCLYQRGKSSDSKVETA